MTRQRARTTIKIDRIGAGNVSPDGHWRVFATGPPGAEVPWALDQTTGQTRVLGHDEFIAVFVGGDGEAR